MWNNRLNILKDEEKSKINIKIINKLLELDTNIINLSIIKLAKELKVAPSSITKVLYKAGYNGWKMYKSFALNSLSMSFKENRDVSVEQYLGPYLVMLEKYNDLIEVLAEQIWKSEQTTIVAFGRTLQFLEIIIQNLKLIGVDCTSINLAERKQMFVDKMNHIYIYVSISGNQRTAATIEKVANKCSLSKWYHISGNVNDNIKSKNVSQIFCETFLIQNKFEKELNLITSSLIKLFFDILLIKITSISPKKITSNINKTFVLN